ncbi:MAG: winged helix DNA-binding protein [Firmicutes bacterium]|nr:winged helix DNA-binding protein [Bacillota bacterium]
MNQLYTNENHRLNYLASEINSLYHQFSIRLGLSDSVSIILYTIYDLGDGCLLSEIYKSSGISKQTIGSAIRSLEEDGILFLAQHDGRSKKVILTEKGKDYVKKTAARIYDAELKALDTWTKEEIETYIRLTEKYLESFRQQIEKG